MTNYLFKQLTTPHIYYLTVCMSQESWCRLAGDLWLRVPQKAIIRSCSHLKAWLGNDMHPSSCTWLLAGLRSPLAAGQRQKVLATWTSHRQLPTWQLASLRVREEARERQKGCPRGKPQAFCHLISEVPSHHFCYNLFIRSGSLGPSKPQGKEITQGHESQELPRGERPYLGTQS